MNLLKPSLMTPNSNIKLNKIANYGSIGNTESKFNSTDYNYTINDNSKRDLANSMKKFR